MKSHFVHPYLLDYMGGDASVLLDEISPSYTDSVSPCLSSSSVITPSSKSKSSQAFNMTRRALVSQRIGRYKPTRRKRFRRTWRRGQLRHAGLLSRLAPLMTLCPPDVSCIVKSAPQTHSKRLSLARPAVRRVL